MDRFGPTGKVSKKQVHLLRWSSFPVGPVWMLVEWIAPHFSRSDRLESWLNGSRPSDLKLSSDACYLGGDPPQCWMRLRAKMLPAMHRREIPRWLSPGSEGWRLPCQNETTGVVVKRERPFCGMWSLTFRPHPRGMVGPRNTTINDIPAQTKGFLYSYEHLNNFRTSRTFILTDFSVY